MEHKKNPTDKDLVEFFLSRVDIRKLTDVEYLRLMDVPEYAIERIKACPFKKMKERDEYRQSRLNRIGELEDSIQMLKADTSAQAKDRKREMEAELKSVKKELRELKGNGISTFGIYKMGGNSIVVNVLYHIFRTLFIPNQPEYEGKLL